MSTINRGVWSLSQKGSWINSHMICLALWRIQYIMNPNISTLVWLPTSISPSSPSSANNKLYYVPYSHFHDHTSPSMFLSSSYSTSSTRGCCTPHLTAKLKFSMDHWKSRNRNMVLLSISLSLHSRITHFALFIGIPLACHLSLKLRT